MSLAFIRESLGYHKNKLYFLGGKKKKKNAVKSQVIPKHYQISIICLNLVP